MLLKSNITHIKKLIHELTDMQLISHIDEFKQLHDSTEVFKLCFWNDVNVLLMLMYEECVERMRNYIQIQDES